MYPVQTGAVQPCQKVVVVIAGLVVLVISGWLLWNQDTLCDLSQQQLVLNVELQAMNEQLVIWQTKLTETESSHKAEKRKVLKLLAAEKRKTVAEKRKLLDAEKRKLLDANKTLVEEMHWWMQYNDTLFNVFSVSSAFTVESWYRTRYDLFFHRVGLDVALEDAYSEGVFYRSWLGLREKEDAGKGDDIIVWIEGATKFGSTEFMTEFNKRVGTVLLSQGDRARLVEHTVLVLVMRKKS